MEDNESIKCELEMDGLSLIDVSSEDDCLLFSSSLDPNIRFAETGMDDKVLGFLGNVSDYGEEIPVSSLQEKEQVLQLNESPEPKMTTKGWKYNLRKSLAWDNAFFTGAGVLDPEELSSIIESNQKGEKQMLYTIQEDVHRSAESISTLQSDCTTGDSHEVVSFEDISASTQRCCNTSGAAVQNGSEESGSTETATTISSSKMDKVSHNKVKPKASPKKTSIGAQGSGKTMKQVTLRPPVSLSVSTRGGLHESVSNPSKGVSRVGPMSTTSTKSSPDVNRAKPEKVAKSSRAAGKGGPCTKGAVLDNSTRNIPPKSVLHSKSSLRSSTATKNDLTSSCSSLESCASASSGSSHKSYLNLIKKNVSSSKPANPSSFTGRTTSRVASRSISQPRNPHLSTHLMSKAKLSSSTSSASVISESPSESSAASTSSQRATRSKVSLKTTSCARSPPKDDTAHTSNSQNTSSDQFSDGHVTQSVGEGLKQVPTGNGRVLHPASMKPTGLRMPSPKIGFFDGVRTVARTPTRNVQTHPGVTGGMPRLGKLGSSRSPLQDSSNSKPKAANVSRTPTFVSVSSPKFQSKMSPKTSGGKQVKAVVDDETMDSVRKGSPASINNTKMILDNGKPDTSIDRNPAFGDQNIIPPIKLGEEGNMKDKIVEDPADKRTKHVEAVDTNMKVEVGKECSGDPHSLVSEHKGVAEAIDNVSGKKIPPAVNNCSPNEDATLGVSSGP